MKDNKDIIITIILSVSFLMVLAVSFFYNTSFVLKVSQSKLELKLLSENAAIYEGETETKLTSLAQLAQNSDGTSFVPVVRSEDLIDPWGVPYKLDVDSHLIICEGYKNQSFYYAIWKVFHREPIEARLSFPIKASNFYTAAKEMEQRINDNKKELRDKVNELEVMTPDPHQLQLIKEIKSLIGPEKHK